MTILGVLLGLLVLIPTPAEVLLVQFPTRSKVSLPLGGKSKADVERLATTTMTKIKMEDLRSPQSVMAGMNTYVAWAVSPEGSFDNLGELEIDGTKGLLEATTRFDRFALVITAEPHYMVDKPSSEVVYRNEAPRNLPGIPLRIDVGAYDYSGLPTNLDLSPKLVMEARAAFSIAASVQKDDPNESEYRQARVAVDTMEELIRRASSSDVIATAAHAAIRQSQRAATAARQSSP